ncbi:MAG: gamma-glutamyltransferase, partial [Acidobacteriota bacterium]
LAPAAAPAPTIARSDAVLEAEHAVHPVRAASGMVATQKAEATAIGLDVLARGGNAVDAAVAVAFALAVVLPRAGNLGGGGFLLYHDAADGTTAALDYRERAPAAAHADLFLDANGDVDEELARYSRKAAGVPGTVAGFAALHRRHGSLPWASLLAPAIRLAREGFPLSHDAVDNLARRLDRFASHLSTVDAFLMRDPASGAPQVPAVGAILRQPDLAWSLEQIAQGGEKAFYDGPIAARLVADMAAHDGLITQEDLRAYRPVWRAPVRGVYRGHEVLSMPPPSSGGVHLIQMLNVLEGFDLASMGAGSAAAIHHMAETMKLAYADRSLHLGDPDFWDVPIAGLTARPYADALRRQIDPARARPARDIAPGRPAAYESPDTTHFSIVDGAGNAISNTYTLNFSYGSGIVAEGTGFLLNNQMDDFAAKPGVPNGYGLLGGAANAVEAGKRPLSSMTPTIVLKDDAPFLLTGSPGGSRIITTVLQILINVIDHDMTIAEATYAPRMHHQWLPDHIRIEPRGFSPDTLRLLMAMGHTIEISDVMGSTQSILRQDDGTWHGCSDARRPDALTRGHD